MEGAGEDGDGGSLVRVDGCLVGMEGADEGGGWRVLSKGRGCLVRMELVHLVRVDGD